MRRQRWFIHNSSIGRRRSPGSRGHAGLDAQPGDDRDTGASLLLIGAMGMRAGRGSGLPWVVVVDRNGRIAWWGQPFYEAFGGVLDAVLAGKWDATREKIARTARRVNERRE